MPQAVWIRDDCPLPGRGVSPQNLFSSFLRAAAGGEREKEVGAQPQTPGEGQPRPGDEKGSRPSPSRLRSRLWRCALCAPTFFIVMFFLGLSPRKNITIKKVMTACGSH